MATITAREPSPHASWAEIARLVGESIAPRAADHDRSGAISTEAFDLVRRSGLAAALVPTQFGGGGAGHEEMGTILRTLGRSDPAVAVTLSMHAHTVATQVWRHHHGHDASRLFAAVAGGALAVSTGASDWVGSNGRALRTDGGYRVSARKTPTSGCEVGDILVTSIRQVEGEGPQVVHCSIPMTATGVSIDHTWDTLGMRATGSHTVVLEDVFVPDAAVTLVRPADEWHPIWNAVLGSAIPLIMSSYLGIADSATELAVAAAVARQGGHLAGLVGEMMNAHTAACDAVAAMFVEADDLCFDNTDELAARTLSRKSAAAEFCIQTVRLAMEVVGGSGYTRESGIERLYRDVHGCLFHPLPRAKQTRFTGQVALGISPRE